MSSSNTPAKSGFSGLMDRVQEKFASVTGGSSSASSTSDSGAVGTADRDLTREECLTRVNDMIKNIQFAMLSCVGSNGEIHSRPMATQDRPFDGTLYFFTWNNTLKVNEASSNPHVNLAYVDNSSHRYVSIAGHASFSQDNKALMGELWSEGLRMWFPKGLEDPDIGLLRVDAASVEYWDSKTNLLHQVNFLVGKVKTAVTGQATEPKDICENKRIDLTQEGAMAHNPGKNHSSSSSTQKSDFVAGSAQAPTINNPITNTV